MSTCSSTSSNLAYDNLALNEHIAWDEVTSEPHDADVQTGQRLQDALQADQEENHEPPIVQQHLEPILLSAAPQRSGHFSTRPSAIYANEMIYSPAVPEYPKTSEDGVAYVIFTEALSRAQEEKPWDSIQYCNRRVHPPSNSSSAFFGSVPVTLHKYQCTGVKICQYLDHNLHLQPHTELDKDYWIQWAKVHQRLSSPDKKREALAWIFTILRNYSQNQACRPVAGGQLHTCKPVLQSLDWSELAGTTQWIIHCQNWSRYSPYNLHHYAVIREDHKPYISLIKKAITSLPELEDDIQEGCCTVDRTNRNRQRCDFTHIHCGPGEMHRLSCGVTWFFFLPKDNILPYFLMVSHGTHTHPPPPPSHTPQHIIQQLHTTLSAHGTPLCSLHIWLQSPELRRVIQDQKENTITDLNPSLANHSNITRLLRQHQVIHYPLGSSRLGAYHEYLSKHKHRDNQYIQIFHDDGSNLLIVMFFPLQIQLLQESCFPTFQMDMSHKHIAMTEENEIIWGVYHHQARCVLPVLRAFISSSTTAAYYYMYSRIFNHLDRYYGIQLQWYHIHGKGIYGVTIDQDWGNITGLGQYLSTIDPQRRSWQWHTLRCVRLCYVHFQRGIEQTTIAAGIRESSLHSVQAMMGQLLYCTSFQDYMSLCDSISTEFPSLQNWALHKKQPIIASGLNKACSPMEQVQWNACHENASYVEQLHKASYRVSGPHTALVHAIRSNQGFDKYLLSRQDITASFGILLSHNNLSLQGQFHQAIGRAREQAKRSTDENRDKNIEIESSNSSIFTQSERQLRSSFSNSHHDPPSAPANSRGIRSVSLSGRARIRETTSPLARETPQHQATRAVSLNTIQPIESVNQTDYDKRLLLIEKELELERAKTHRLELELSLQGRERRDQK